MGSCRNSIVRHSAAKSKRLRNTSCSKLSAQSQNYDPEGLDEEVIQFLNAEFSTTRTFCSGSALEIQPVCSETSSNTENAFEDVPQRFRHIRRGSRSVRPEIYDAAHTLNSAYDMSARQIEGAFIVVGGLFGAKWRAFEAGRAIDEDTLPELTNLEVTRINIEAASTEEYVSLMLCIGSFIVFFRSSVKQVVKFTYHSFI
jgi:hypothetical protein